MADIDIERKSGAPWLWILMGVIVLALLAWLLFPGDDDTVATVPAYDEPTAAVMPEPIEAESDLAMLPEVRDYMTTCAEPAAGEMGVDHEYTSRCIDLLVRSTEATLARPNLGEVDATAELQAARQASERLASTATDAEHATMTRDAFTAVADLLGKVQDDRFPALDGQATQLQQTAGSLDPAQPLLDQRTAVQDFFRQAGMILNGFAAPA